MSRLTRSGRRTRTAAGLVVALLAGIISPLCAFEHWRLQRPEVASEIDPSGVVMPAGPRRGWELAFADDFRQDVPTGQFPTAVADRWRAYPDGWPDTSKNGTYYPSKVVSIHDGVMDLYLRTEDGAHLVAAPVPRTAGPASDLGYRYGRYAVRFRSDRIQGYKVAWLLWPDSEKWSDGEINLPEGNLDGTISGFLHHRGAPEKQNVYDSRATFDTWHTAVIEWTPQSVRFILDGTLIGESRDRSKIPDQPMHWVLQTETNLEGRRPAARVSGHVLIDWVVAYRRQDKPPPL